MYIFMLKTRRRQLPAAGLYRARSLWPERCPSQDRLGLWDSIRKCFSAVCSSFREENTFPFAFRLRVTSPGTGLKGEVLSSGQPFGLSKSSMSHPPMKMHPFSGIGLVIFVQTEHRVH